MVRGSSHRSNIKPGAVAGLASRTSCVRQRCFAVSSSPAWRGEPSAADAFKFFAGVEFSDVSKHGACKAQGSYISFLTPEPLFRTLTPSRWSLIQAVIGASPISVDEIARRVNRASKIVHRDVQALLNAGVLDVNADGAVVFPYDAVHVDFVLSGSHPEREMAPLERLRGSVQRYDDPTDPVAS